MRCRNLMALGALIPLLIAAVGAESLTSIPNPRTRDGTWVTDMPGTLRADTIARLNPPSASSSGRTAPKWRSS